MFARRIETKRPFPRVAGTRSTNEGLPPGIVGLCVTTNQLRVGRVGSTPARTAIAHESKGLTPMAGAGAGRGTKHEKEFAIGRTLSTAPRGEFHDRVSGQQHAGTQATWGPPPPVLGPCQWHRAYRARSRSNRGEPSAHEAARPARTEHARPRSSPALRFGGRGGGKRERPSGGGSVRADRGFEPSVILYPCASRVVSQRLNAH